ncbi:hypothetical protein FOPG_20122, partial [Fusarium oxysporum f. sp. conglutinans race 2 54008]
MSLLHLPNELLQRIAQNLESDKDINAFLRANRRLRDLLNTGLYQRNIKQSGSSGLLWIVRHGRLKAAKTLLREAAKSQVASDAFPIALLLAAGNGREDMVKLLLDNGTGVNVQVEEYGTALQAAASEG